MTYIALAPAPQYCYLPPGWDAAWRTAKTNVGSSRIVVTGIGDSIMQGWMASDVLTTSWWALLRSAILTANGNALSGDHYNLMLSAAAVAIFGGPGTATYPFVIAGTANTNYGLDVGMYNYAAFNITAQSPFITFTTPYVCTAFDILYVDGFQAGSWSYKVDGGSATTVTTSGSGSTSNGQIKKISVSSLSNTTHTVVINSLDANFGSCIIGGITTYKSTTGVTFANMGWPGMGLITGSQANNNLFSGTNATPIDRVALYQGYTGTVASPTALSGFGFPTQPDLAIIALGVNDASASVTRANFRDGLDRLVWSLRYGKSDACSILLLANWGPDGTLGTSSTITNQDQTANSWTAYRDLRAAMLEVAQAEECAYVDIHGFFGRKPVTNGWINSATDIHPTTSGHSKIETLLSALV